jgi:hypothetical protein
LNGLIYNFGVVETVEIREVMNLMWDATSDINRTAQRGIVGMGKDLVDAIVDGWPTGYDKRDPNEPCELLPMIFVTKVAPEPGSSLVHVTMRHAAMRKRAQIEPVIIGTYRDAQTGVIVKVIQGGSACQ